MDLSRLKSLKRLWKESVDSPLSRLRDPDLVLDVPRLGRGEYDQSLCPLQDLVSLRWVILVLKDRHLLRRLEMDLLLDWLNLNLEMRLSSETRWLLRRILVEAIDRSVESRSRTDDPECEVLFTREIGGDNKRDDRFTRETSEMDEDRFT